MLARLVHIPHKLIVLLLVCVLLTSGAQAGGVAGRPSTPAPTGAATDSNQRPNIIFIVTDDERAGDPRFVMPNTRKWFYEGGAHFPNGFASTPLCCPSRSSIMTGRYVHNHRVLRNSDALALDQRDTIQRYLQQRGYTTAIFGKYLNSWNLANNPPYFDRWAISSGGHYNTPFNVQGQQQRIAQYQTDYVASRAAGFLREHDKTRDNQPFFLYVAPYAPHAPFTPPERYRNSTVPPFEGNPAVDEADRSDKPPYVRQTNLNKQHISEEIPRQQKRMLLSVDDLVASVMGTLQETGEAENTIVVFISDNGYLWGEHGLTGKSAPYTQSIRVPFFLRWPRRVQAGAVDNRLVANVDLVPTVLDALYITPDKPLDGRSLLTPNYKRNRLLTEYWGASGAGAGTPTWASLRTATYQYVEYYSDDARTNVVFREYYDLVKDPWQLTNLLHDGNPNNNPDVAALGKRLAADKNCAGPGCP